MKKLIAALLLAAVMLGIPTTANAATRVTTKTIIAVAGDSTTYREDSWRYQFSDPKYTIRGGFAMFSYTTAQVLAEFRPAYSDVLVVKLGTNDVRVGMTTEETLSNIEAIVALNAKGNADQRVVLSAIVPCDLPGRRQAGAELNLALKALAIARGWEFVDPDGKFRTKTNRFKHGTTKDGVHPTTKAFAAEARFFEGYFK